MAPQSRGQQPAPKKNGCMGCLAFAGLFFVVFTIANMAGCEWTKTNDAGTTSSSPVAVSRPTKAEWLAKVVSRYGQSARFRVIENWPVNGFKSFMGEPDRTQTFGDHAFWYYDCSDGVIQLSLFAGNLAAGVMGGNINDH